MLSEAAFCPLNGGIGDITYGVLSNINRVVSGECGGCGAFNGFAGFTIMDDPTCDSFLVK